MTIWHRVCKSFNREHDKLAKVKHHKNACGYCGTEDCSCEGYDEKCECSCCEDFTGRRDKCYSSNGWPTFKNIAMTYLYLEARKPIRKHFAWLDEMRERTK